MKRTLLIVEDDTGIRDSLEKSFRRRDYEVIGAGGISEANRIMRERKVDVILLDIRLSDGSGLEVLTASREIDKETDVIIMTAYPELKTAIQAMKEGARDYIIKPFELDEMHLSVERAVESRELRRTVRRLKREREKPYDISEILGKSSAIDNVRAQIGKVAKTDTPVLVTGETGTGKELVADSIHNQSGRSGGPFVKVNCSAFAEQLLENELFGHEKGAFTDAKESRAGLFEMAGGGTLFLDEISEMRVGLQAKMLRVVEGQSFRRVGGQREIRTDVRVIAVTNRDIHAIVKSGVFRDDLYYRLNVFPIEVPPLRVRGNDIALLAKAFLDRSAAALRKGSLKLSGSAEKNLLDYNWPGNVRELMNVMERAAILCEGDTVGAEHLPVELHVEAFMPKNAVESPGKMPPLEVIELRYIEQIVKSVGGNLSEAARILGITRNTLKSKYRKP